MKNKQGKLRNIFNQLHSTTVWVRGRGGRLGTLVGGECCSQMTLLNSGALLRNWELSWEEEHPLNYMTGREKRRQAVWLMYNGHEDEGNLFGPNSS